MFNTKKTLKIINIILKAKGIWLRAIISFLIGLSIILFVRDQNYDLRFQLRGQQTFDKNITLMYINTNNVAFLGDNRLKNWFLKENQNKDSSILWDIDYWQNLLSKLLDMQVDKIIININFDKRLLLGNSNRIFENPKIFWTNNNSAPSFSFSNLNIYSSEFIQDKDGQVRDYYKSINGKLNILEKSFPSSFIDKSKFINFRGPSGTFHNLILTDDTTLNKKQLMGKTVIIGTETLSDNFKETPVGKMNVSEIQANVIDNIRNKRWVESFSISWNIFYLIAILFLSLIIMFNFPQSVALTYLMWLTAGLSALSLALFDNYNFWLPVLAPIIQMASTYVFFLSYQLNVKENKNWKLEEEQKIQNQSQQLKNNFVSLISHDLKTPIAKIQGICDRIISVTPDTHLIEDIHAVRKETDHLNKYIQSILQITKVEAKDFKIQKKPVDINKIIEKVLSHLQFMVIERQNTIKLNLDPLFLIEADTVLMYEVFLNIIENSLKYAPNSVIEIKTFETDQYVHINIKDNGPGIDTSDLKHIFEKFYRAKSTKNKIKGTGLGLYLVKYFVQLHNGSISINSEVDVGTEFQIKLPIE